MWLLYPCVELVAQNGNDSLADSVHFEQLEEVVFLSQNNLSDKAAKPLSTLDNYLEKANALNMIRRGSYAWEPLLNGMTSERNVITIDKMRIYGACTDKMDPVTSYVEITNLAKANVHSGPSGATGAGIGGGLDLERKKSSFGEKSFSGMVFGGFETNNQQKVAGSALTYADRRFFTNVDLTFRGAENYKAGGGREVLYSQFTKYNASAVVGYKIKQHQHIEASVIYDHAVNVGYPALPMDVSLAKAFIGAVEYVKHHISPAIHQWETKLYYNDVTHIMDDTKRPVVPIRMDMPGWSKTAGFYSLLQGVIKKHSWKSNVSGHYNRSIAEMTMFSNTPGEKDMFMLTWPGVQTGYGDIFAEDKIVLSRNWILDVNAGIAVHHNNVDNQFGFESLKIFYPEMKKSNTRLLKRASAAVEYKKEHWSYNAGLAYGERAPSVSEGYGFYLFNSFDRFDYIGNPDMRNEKSVSANGGVSYNQPKLLAKLSASYFHITDYIIGRPVPDLSTMTIGAEGVKMYEQIKYADIFNLYFDFNYALTQQLLWSNRLSYRSGSGAGVGDLPLIQPFSYTSDMRLSLKAFSADISIHGAAKQHRFNPDFGERELPAYIITNLSVANIFYFKESSILLKAGVENLFDQSYTTFADWNRLPRMGRNIYLNVIYKFR